MADLAFWRHLFAHELKAHLSSGVFLLLAGTSLVLSLFAANAGIRQFAIASSQYDHYIGQRQKLADVQLMGWATEPALRVVRPPEPGSILVRGLERARVAFWDVSPSGLADGPVTEALDQRSASGPLFDCESVIRILIGLLAVLLGVRTVAVPRRDGTLQALLDLPVGRSTIAAAKLTAVLAALASALALLWLATAGLVWALEPALMAEPLPTAGVLVSAAGWVYAGTLAMLGMVVGSLSRSVTAAGGFGIGVWAFLALAYPQLGTFSAHAIAPLPSRPVVAAEKLQMYDGRLASTMAILGQTAAGLVSERDGAVDLERNPEAKAILDSLWHDDAVETRYILQVIEDRANAAEAWHDQVAAWFSAASPSTVFTRSTAALVDTGLTGETRWRAAVERYQATLEQLFFDDPPRFTLLVSSGDGTQRVGVGRHPAPVAADLPGFEPPRPDLRTRLSDAARDLLLLAGYFALFAVVAVVTFPAGGELLRDRGRRAL